MQNPNFVFGKKKKAWFAKNFAFKKHGKTMDSRMDPTILLFLNYDIDFCPKTYKKLKENGWKDEMCNIFNFQGRK